MTELEQLQEQIKRLEKTVDELKNGTVKVIPLKDRLSQEQCLIFNKYFESKFDKEDDYWDRGDLAKPGFVIANEQRDKCRNAIRDTCRAIFIMNNYSEFSDISNFRFDKLLKSEEQIQEYLQLFESLCKMSAEKLENERFIVKGGE